MLVGGIAIDAIHLREGRVVVEGEVSFIVQIYPSKNGGVIIVRSINLQSASETR